MAACYNDIILTQLQSRLNATKQIFDALERGLSDDLVLLQPNEEGKRTFFDNDPKEEEKEVQIDTSKNQEIQAPLTPRQSLTLNPNLCLSSLDLTVYAYL